MTLVDQDTAVFLRVASRFSAHEADESQSHVITSSPDLLLTDSLDHGLQCVHIPH